MYNRRMLTLFRLHTKKCIAGRARLDRSYRKCHCPVHVEGKCGSDFVREGLRTTSWQRAQQRVMEAEARGSWNPPPEEQKAERQAWPTPQLRTTYGTSQASSSSEFAC